MSSLNCIKCGEKEIQKNTNGKTRIIKNDNPVKKKRAIQVICSKCTQGLLSDSEEV